MKKQQQQMEHVFSKWFDTAPHSVLIHKTLSVRADVNRYEVGAKLAWQEEKCYKSPLGLSFI